VHPATGEVCVTLTDNSDRGKRYPTDAANPRSATVAIWRSDGRPIGA